MDEVSVTTELNEFGQPVDFRVVGWTPPPFPKPEVIHGRTCSVEPLDPSRHAESLHAANTLDVKGFIWTYLGYGPFASIEEYREWLKARAVERDPSFYAIVKKETGRAVGVASYLRIDPPSGVIEVGHLAFSPLLQKTVAATEAMYLMMSRAFDLGYRRYEWKCHALNAASRQAAMRLGMSFEGVFRQAAISRGRNRDTAWYAVLDRDWPTLRAAFQEWLDPANFDKNGKQKTALSTLTAPVVAQRG